MEEELTLLLKQRNDLTEEKQSKERFYAHYKTPANTASDPDIQAINGQMAELDKQIAATVQRKAQYDDLARELQLDEENYKAAHTRALEAEANQSLNQQQITRVSIIEQPTLPYKPTRPWRAVIVLLCFMAGIALGIAACILMESLDQSFSLPAQAAAELGIPMIASFSYRTPKLTGALI